MTEVLLYTSEDAHDYLGLAIKFFERGTFTHVALYRDGVIVDAVFPRVRMLTDDDAAKAYKGASSRTPLIPLSDERDTAVWAALVHDMVGKRYSLSTLVSDALSYVGVDMIVRAGGRVVCSALALRYAQLVGDPRVPMWHEFDNASPADLAEMLVGERIAVV